MTGKLTALAGISSSAAVTATGNLLGANVVTTGKLDGATLVLSGAGTMGGKLTAVGIMSTASLTAVGNIHATGTVFGASDRRLKTNVQPITDAIPKLLQIRGVRHTQALGGLANCNRPGVT
jgi:hypothetical protein